jgi:hypothetical protein
MRIRQWCTWLALSVALLSSGCCWHRHHCRKVRPAPCCCEAPCASCGCGAPVGLAPPIAPAVPVTPLR